MGRTTTILLVVALLLPVSAESQAQPNPTQRPLAEQDQIPVFRVTVVGRTTPAINYRPRSGDTRIDFAGTPLMPDADGRATIKGQKGYIEIDAKFKDVGAASQFGPEYLTYVLWAITPEGRARNLGEIQITGDDGDLKVTTELQAFGLVVTAEPYFAVTQPSDVVVMENVVREGSGGTIGNIEVINAKYELLKRGSYLMHQDVSRFKAKPIEPGASLDLAEARNAVELARLASADRFAGETFDKAVGLLEQAEQARARRRGGNAVMMPARQAVQTAEDARLIALQRQEEAFITEQQKIARERELSALERAQAEEARRRQAEIDKQNEEARRRQAELDRQNEEARRRQAESDKRAAEEARLAAERAKADADRAAARLAEERRAAEAAKASAEAARAAAEAQTLQAQAAVAQSEREKSELREKLRQQLNVILETRETARGLIVNLSDVLFDTGSANLKPGAREKLSRIAGILLAHPGLQVDVEGHTDSVGAEGYNQRLSESRAASVHAYLIRQGIAQTAVATAGYGEGQPVASNTTAAGRQQNRRVELVVTGEPIGRTR
jgi:outer membrane protein OmpA-like peptidoglycan-associated protein